MTIGDSVKNLSLFSCSVMMTLVTLLSPTTITSYGWGRTDEVYWVDIAVIAILWIFLPQSGNWNPMGFGLEGYGFYFLNPVALFNTFPYWFLTIIFAIQVVRFRRGKADGKKTLLLGLLSLLPPCLLAFIGYMGAVQAGILVYFGPLPFQFLLGYFLMRYSTNWEISSPFHQEETKSWWEKDSLENESKPN